MASLFDETPFEPYGRVAPYVVRLSPASPMLDWAFTQHALQDRGVILLASRSGLAPVTDHLRSLLMVHQGDGDELLNFRFYDADVLEAYLRHVSGEELARFMGPIASIYVWRSEQQSPQVYPHPGAGALALRIGAAQMAAFRELALDHFARRAAAHLRQLFPNMTEPEAIDTLQRAVALGGELGITTEHDVSLLANIMARTTTALDTHADYVWVMEILRDQSRSPRGRLDAVLGRLDGD
jgi:hypothetical protein